MNRHVPNEIRVICKCNVLYSVLLHSTLIFSLRQKKKKKEQRVKRKKEKKEKNSLVERYFTLVGICWVAPPT